MAQTFDVEKIDLMDCYEGDILFNAVTYNNNIYAVESKSDTRMGLICCSIDMEKNMMPSIYSYKHTNADGDHRYDFARIDNCIYKDNLSRIYKHCKNRIKGTNPHSIVLKFSTMFISYVDSHNLLPVLMINGKPIRR